MRSSLTAFLGAAALLCVVPASRVAAQDRLQNSDLRTVVAVLEAEILENERSLQLRQGTYTGPSVWDEFDRAAPQLQNRSLDPLAWIESHSRRVPVPPGAAYVPGCSRYVTRLRMHQFAELRDAMSEFALGIPVVAIFTLNLPAGGATDFILANPGVSEQELRARRMNLVSQEANAAFARAGTFFEHNGFRARSFQRTEWFSSDYTRDALRIHLLNSTLIPAPGTRLAPDTEGANFESTSEDANSCRGIPSGPFFAVFLDGLPGERPESFRDAMLARLGLRDESTTTPLRQAADWAWRDLTDPDQSGLPYLEQEAAEEGKDYAREQLAARQHNREWYRRHSATLDPLFRELERQQEERERVSRGG